MSVTKSGSSLINFSFWVKAKWKSINTKTFGYVLRQTTWLSLVIDSNWSIVLSTDPLLHRNISSITSESLNWRKNICESFWMFGQGNSSWFTMSGNMTLKSFIADWNSMELDILIRMNCVHLWNYERSGSIKNLENFPFKQISFMVSSTWRSSKDLWIFRIDFFEEFEIEIQFFCSWRWTKCVIKKLRKPESLWRVVFEVDQRCGTHCRYTFWRYKSNIFLYRSSLSKA